MEKGTKGVVRLFHTTGGRVLLHLRTTQASGAVWPKPFALLPEEALPQPLDDDIVSLGTFEIPVFIDSQAGSRAKNYFYTKGVAADRVEEHLRREGGEHKQLVWVKVSDALARFESNEWLFDPHTLQLLRWLHALPPDEFVGHCVKQATSGSYVGTAVDLEYSPHVFVVPIVSNTIQPFTTTNLVVLGGEGKCVIVDPGASQAGRAHTEAVLRHLIPSSTIASGEVMVFLTHHHKDHCEALDLIHDLYPSAKVLCHEKTMGRVETRLEKVIVKDRQVLISDPGLHVEVLDAGGHTEGHMALWERNGRVVIAGDHVVGVGSAVLDARSGQSLSSNQQRPPLTNWDITQGRRGHAGVLQDHAQAHRARTGHGPLHYDPCALLRSYIAHRQAREDQILAAITHGGAQTEDDIVRQVYKDVPQALWVHAKSNIYLHVKKLADEQRLPASFSLAVLHKL